MTDKQTTNTAPERHWIDAGTYSFALDGDTIIARNATGRVLKTVPAKAKALPEFEQLDNLRIFIAQHKKSCRTDVTTWFLKGLPVPATVIAAVWPDYTWRSFLKDLVITVQSDGPVGLLRDAAEQHLRIIDLDGETLNVAVDDALSVVINHPAVLDDIADWREFAVELGVVQGIDQLFRDLYFKPTDEETYRKKIRSYCTGKYNKAATLIGRSRGGGFATTLQEVSMTVVENGEETAISLDIDAWDLQDAAHIGQLHFYSDGKSLELADIGPIAWSEGIRMAEYVYVGRDIDTETEKN